jgi:hypothetical protein
LLTELASEQKEKLGKMFAIVKRFQLSNIWREGRNKESEIDKLSAEAREMIHEYQNNSDVGRQNEGVSIFQTKDLPQEFPYHVLYCSIIRHKLSVGSGVAKTSFRMFRYIIMMVIVAQAMKLNEGSESLERFIVEVMGCGKVEQLGDCDYCLYTAINLPIIRINMVDGVAEVTNKGLAADMAVLKIKGVIS